MKKEYISNKSSFNGKIISLLASTTEIICVLGLKDNLVGISHECDNPNSILNLPRCSDPKINIHGTSVQIDNEIIALIKQSISIYNVNEKLLKQLKPDIIFTQDMCKVCAVNPNDLYNYLNYYTQKKVKIYSYSPNSLEEILLEIKNIGLYLDCEDGVSRLISDMKIRIKTFREENDKIKFKPKVAFVEWINPIYVGGNWIPELIEIAGGTSCFGVSGEHSTIINFDEIVEHDPDCILIAPCGYNIQKTLSELKSFITRSEWNYLKAVRKNMVFILDGNRYFNRPGMSILNSIEIISEIIHPEKFIYKYENIGWIRLIEN